MNAARDFDSDLQEQLAFLEASCSGFDRGMEIEAKRLAVTLRVLLHDTGASKSLLGQMGVKNRLQWLSSGEVDPSNILSTHSLTIIRFYLDDTGKECMRYIPRDGETILGSGKLKSFDDWWNDPVIKDFNREEFSRRDLVLALANRDGGAHIDNLQARVRRLAHEGGLGWKRDNGEPIVLNPILSSVRTIVNELVLTLHNQQETLGTSLPWGK